MLYVVGSCDGQGLWRAELQMYPWARHSVHTTTAMRLILFIIYSYKSRHQAGVHWRWPWVKSRGITHRSDGTSSSIIRKHAWTNIAAFKKQIKNNNKYSINIVSGLKDNHWGPNHSFVSTRTFTFLWNGGLIQTDDNYTRLFCRNTCKTSRCFPVNIIPVWSKTTRRAKKKNK